MKFIKSWYGRIYNAATFSEIYTDDFSCDGFWAFEIKAKLIDSDQEIVLYFDKILKNYSQEVFFDLHDKALKRRDAEFSRLCIALGCIEVHSVYED